MYEATVLAHNMNRHPNIQLVKNPNDPKIASTENKNLP